VNLIDTAECYGDHLAETLVGRAITGRRDRWIVATKFGHRFHADRAGQPGADPGSVRTDHWMPTEVIAQLEGSLRALRTDYIDIYQSHGGSDADFATPGLWDALTGQVQAGKIRHLGISLDPADAARAANARSVGAGVVQVTYNRLNRAAEDTVFPEAIEQGCRGAGP
jgi:aryl-alcohol dehydrogenase-like predicted oxidoreductase